MITDGIEMIIVVVWKKMLIVLPMPVMEHVVGPDDEGHEAQEDGREDQ